METLKWTRKKPSKKGWYARRGHGHDPVLMHAHYDRDYDGWWVDTMYEEGGEPVEELHDDYEWFGPLPGKLTPKPNGSRENRARNFTPEPKHQTTNTPEELRSPHEDAEDISPHAERR